MLCTNLVVRTPKDGRGISQKQVLEQNLSSTDVHGRTSVERYSGCTTVEGSNGLTASIFCDSYLLYLMRLPVFFKINRRV